MNPEEVFRRIINAFDQAGITYMLTGSFASAYYGALRSTQDIDFVIETTPAQLETFVRNLPSNEYYADLDAALDALGHESMFNVIDMMAGWKIDLIFRKSRAFSREEFRRRKPADLHGLMLFVTSAEDIILAKLEWSKRSQSQRQIEDVVAILRLRRESLDTSYLERWTRELNVEKEWLEAQRAAGK